jgi:hypothetical protein
LYAEVRRVAKPGGILAAWGYMMPMVSPEVEAVVRRFDTEVLEGLWLPQTKHAVDGYRSIPFPFDGIETPPFRMTHTWDCDRLLGYLGTWSASFRYREQKGRDATDEIRDEMMAAWGDQKQARKVVLDLHLRAGQVSGR